MALWHWMQGGGWGIWFVLTFSLISLASGAHFAVRPDLRGEAAVRSFSRATLFSITAVVSLDLAAVGSRIPATPEWAHSPDLHLIVLEGIAESLARHRGLRVSVTGLALRCSGPTQARARTAAELMRGHADGAAASCL